MERSGAGRRARGLSGAIAAILMAAILIVGLSTTLYISQRGSQIFQRQAEEALRQARLNQELIRIYIHSEDGTLDKPAYITFVNGWGFESKILKILVVSKNYTVVSEVDLNPPLLLGPGARLSIRPETIGLSYPTFRAFADNIAALIAYTDAGNRFGSTWGYPREDNLLGETTVTTYNLVTTQVIYVPPFTTVNQTVTINPITTLNPPEPVPYTKIYARASFEKIIILTAPNLNGDQDPGYSSTTNDQIVSGAPSHPDPDWRNVITVLRGQSYPPRFLPTNQYYDYGLGYKLWFWAPTGEFYTVTGNPASMEGNSYYVVYNAPREYKVTVSGSNGYCTVTYGLGRVEITPLPKDGFNVQPQGQITRIAMVGTLTHAPVPTRTYTTTITIGYNWRITTVTEYMSRVGAEPTFTAINAIQAQLMHKDPYNWNNPTAVKMENKEIWMSFTAPSATATFTVTYGSKLWTYWRAVAWPTTISTLTLQNVRAAYVLLGSDPEYVVDRYYYVRGVSCYTYFPPPPAPPTILPNPTSPPGGEPPPRCELLVEYEGTTITRAIEGGGGEVVGAHYARFRLICPPL